MLEIAENLGLSRGTVSKFVQAGAFPERANPFRTKSIIDPYLEYLEKRWQRVNIIPNNCGEKSRSRVIPEAIK